MIRQLIEASTISGYRGVGAIPADLGYQDYGGRIMREPLRTHGEDRRQRRTATSR